MSMIARIHRRRLLNTSLLMTGAMIALAGCEAHRAAHTGDAKPGATGDKTEQVAIDLQTVSKEGFEKVIASHKGKVVLVDFWATWCPPCVKQFPHTVELWHKHKDKGLDVISVSVDETKDNAEVRKFLASQGAGFQNLITEYGLNAISEFDVDNGGVPCYWIYDREGKLVDRISPGDPTKKFTPQQIDDAVERALAAAAPAPVADAAASADDAKPAEESKPADDGKPAP